MAGGAGGVLAGSSVQVPAATTCRDRQRQLLAFVDDERRVSPEGLMKAVADTACPVGHDLHYASLMAGLLESHEDGSIGLGRAGDEWLLVHGAAAPNWRASVAAGAPPLRGWQEEALRAWCAHGRHGVIEAVTGTGKSRVGVEATREALAQDFSVVLVVPTVDLVTQWVKALRVNGVGAVGVLGDGQRASFATHPVIVGTVQSLHLDPPTRPDGKVLLVADECHRYGAGKWQQVLHPSYRRRLGLTATFERNDDGLKALLAYFGGGPVYSIGFQRAIAEGVVARYDVRLLGVPLNHAERVSYDAAQQVLDDCRKRLLMADFPAEPFGAFLQEVQRAAEGDEDPTVEDLARRYLKAFSDRIEVMSRARAKVRAVRDLAPVVQDSCGAILFTRRVEAAEEIADALVEEGVRAAPIHSDLTRTARQDRLLDLRTGRVKALVAPTILDEGIDVPDIDLAVVMGGSKSRRQMIQRMGRVLRLKGDGRKAAFIVVYAIDTAEDLTQCDGAEGCLDLILASADSVEQWGPANRGRSAEAAPVRAPAVVPGSRTAPVVPEAMPMGEAAPAAASGPVPPIASPLLAGINLGQVAMTRHALHGYQRRYGGSDPEAEAAIRATTQKLLRTGRLIAGDARHLTLRGDDVEVALARDHSRFVYFLSRDEGGQPRPEPGNQPLTRAWRRRLQETAPEHVSALEWADPQELLGLIDPWDIHISRVAFRTAVKIFNLTEMTDEEADQGFRRELQQDVAAGSTVEAQFGRFAVHGAGRSWFIRDDGLSILALKPRAALPTAAPAGLPQCGPTAVVQAERAADDAVVEVEPPTPGSGTPFDLVGQIERLAALHERGLLTEREFAAAKQRVLS